MLKDKGSASTAQETIKNQSNGLSTGYLHRLKNQDFGLGTRNKDTLKDKGLEQTTHEKIRKQNIRLRTGDEDTLDNNEVGPKTGKEMKLQDSGNKQTLNHLMIPNRLIWHALQHAWQRTDQSPTILRK